MATIYWPAPDTNGLAHSYVRVPSNKPGRQTPRTAGFHQQPEYHHFAVRAGVLNPGLATVEAYFNDLNAEILGWLEVAGEAFISNAILDGAFLLLVCVVNFRTSLVDIEALPEIVTRLGQKVDQELRPASLAGKSPYQAVGKVGQGRRAGANLRTFHQHIDQPLVLCHD